MAATMGEERNQDRVPTLGAPQGAAGGAGGSMRLMRHSVVLANRGLI